MSTQNLHAFLDKAKKNDKLKSRLSEIGGPQEVVQLGKEWGYDFTELDLERATQDKLKSGELKQQDLEGVSGGTIISIIVMTVTICGKAA